MAAARFPIVYPSIQNIFSKTPQKVNFLQCRFIGDLKYSNLFSS